MCPVISFVYLNSGLTRREYLSVCTRDMLMYISFLSVMVVATGQISILSLGRHFDVVKFYMYLYCYDAVAQLVEALRHKPEGRGFDSRWCHWNFLFT